MTELERKNKKEEFIKIMRGVPEIQCKSACICHRYCTEHRNENTARKLQSFFTARCFCILESAKYLVYVNERYEREQGFYRGDESDRECIWIFLPLFVNYFTTAMELHEPTLDSEIWSKLCDKWREFLQRYKMLDVLSACYNVHL